MSPESAGDGRNIRLNPARTEGLSLDRYDLRARDGKLICTVSRDRAEQGIADGQLELWQGVHGAYLRPVTAAYPTASRQTDVTPDSLHPRHGRVAAAAANSSALHRHNDRGCRTWRDQWTNL
jgi:hypothetical protein